MQFSKYTTAALVSVALCVSSTSASAAPAAAAAAAAAACQSGQPGCVLPVGEAAPPPVVQIQTPAPIQTGPYVAPEPSGGGIGLFPILLGLAALAALYYFVIRDDNDDDVVTPA